MPTGATPINASFTFTVQFFTNVSQYENANIVNFVLALPLEKKRYVSMKYNSLIPTDM